MSRPVLIAIAAMFALAGGLLFFWSRGPAVQFVGPSTEKAQSVSGLVLAQGGQGVGVALDLKGNVLYLARPKGTGVGNRELVRSDVILRLDPNSGKVLQSLGARCFKVPHGLSVDPKGNIWATDLMLHKIIKFSPRGALLRTYGRRPSGMDAMFRRLRRRLRSFPVRHHMLTFDRPTDVEGTTSGDFFVADGYSNHRIARFKASGELVWERNRLGNGPGEFFLPHGLALDELARQNKPGGRVYVADRSNARVQVLDADTGRFLKAFSGPGIGRPYGLSVRGGRLYVADGGDGPYGGKPTSAIVMLGLDGKVLGRFARYGRTVGELAVAHDVAVDARGRVFVAELESLRLQRLTIAPR